MCNAMCNVQHLGGRIKWDTIYKDVHSLEIMWTDKDEDGQKKRNAVARNLRKEGYTVKCQTVGFSDLARAEAYFLKAEKAV